ncbi:MAG: L-seryl-tRNA(Sec) selenium transferase [Lachnospiraceae bacterium]|nr:L-seryl-tRNA(Sec) selenium transferase [Lachnospiraceae bacterium]
MMDNRQLLLRGLPKIDELLLDEQLVFFMESTPRSVVVDAAREIIAELRREILSGEREDTPEKDELIAEICDRITGKKKRNLRTLINATGVVLHTNLGRSNLCRAAVESVTAVADSYSNLEYDLKKGARGLRHDHVEKIIAKITGAEAAMVVNNNAAATMLCLSAMAIGKEVITSRGELVEIGGSFRIPEIMEQSGAHLKEVGTTNKTKPSDYRNAYPEKTGALMKVHTSNYRILGFTQEVTLKEMVDLGKEMNLPVIYDMGSGLMADLTRYGVDEPTVLDAVNDGADVVLFSGDKLLGGPQGGILIGKKEYIDRMKKHPLARAFRVDKMTLAAMEATFFEYLDMENAKKTIPVLQMITVSGEELQNKADRLIEAIKARTDAFTLGSEPCKDQVGGGSAPTVRLNGIAVSIASETVPAERLERLFRRAETPVIVRVAHDKVLLSVRTIKEEEIETAASAVLFAAAQAGVN